MKKSLIFWFAAVTCAALFLVGCESPTNGDAGAAGAPGTIYLSGSQTTAGIQDAIDSGAPLVFAGVAQYDNGTVTIPAGRGVKLVGDDAYTVADNAAAFLILGDASSVTGTGGIDAQSNGNVIGPQAVLDASVTGGNKLVYQTIGTGGAIDFTGNKAAVNGNVTIATAGVTGSTIPAASLNGKTLYVVGGLTVSNAVTATEISVVGNVTAAAAITGKLSATGKVTFTTAAQGALTGLTAGSVESSVAITTTSNGDITVDGELKTTGASSTVTVNGTGTLTAGSLDLAGNLVAGSGGVTVKGASVLGGDVTRGDGAVTFGGNVTLTDGKTITLTGTAKLNLKGGASIKVGANTVLSASGDVEITPTTGAVLTATSATKTIAVSTAGIAFTGALLVSGELKANGKDITATQTTGILAIAPGGKITTAGAANAGAIVLGDSTNGVTLTGAGSWTAGGAAVYLTQTGTDAAAIGASGAATLTASGTTPAINVLGGSSAANVLTLGAGVTINVAGTAAKVGAVVLTGAGSNVGTLKLVDGTSKVITGNTGGAAYTTGVKQTVAADVTTINDTVIVIANTNKIVSVAGGGAGNGTIAGGSTGTISIDGETSTTDAST